MNDKELLRKKAHAINIVSRMKQLRNNYTKKELIDAVRHKISVNRAMTKERIIELIIESESW